MTEYKKALRRLTLGYMLAIFVACAAFTLPVLIIAQRHIGEGVTFFNHSADVLSQQTIPGELREQIAGRAAEGQRRLLLTTAAVDIVLLSLGSIASYFFARKTLAPLEAAHKAQQRFTADASHELRTPLAAMQTSLEVALKSGKNRAGLESAIHGAIEEIRGLSALTEKLLQLSRADNSGVHAQRLNLSTVIDDTARQCEDKYGVVIVRHIASSLYTEADETLLRQLLQVLIDNAVKYAGHKAPNIEIRLTKHGQNGLLEVADHGIGISKKDLPHVFGRLYRGANTNGLEGHGLGLALAKSVADAQGWKLTITSELGRGTTVRLQFPMYS